MLILGTVVDEEQESRRRHAVDDRLEDRLGLGVHPVEILEHDDERLHLTFAQQQTLDGFERSLPALRRIEAVPAVIVDRGVEKSEQRRERWLQGAIQRKELAGDFLPD